MRVSLLFLPLGSAPLRLHAVQIDLMLELRRLMPEFSLKHTETLWVMPLWVQRTVSVFVVSKDFLRDRLCVFSFYIEPMKNDLGRALFMAPSLMFDLNHIAQMLAPEVRPL